MAHTSAAWASFLDALESELHAVERTPEGRARPAPAFVPPTDLGPLPGELATRARELLASMASTADLVRADMARTTEQLRELRLHDPRGPRPAASFDSRD